MPELLYECEFHADVYFGELEPLPYGAGQRVWAGVTGGTIDGERLKGKVTRAGGDWLEVVPDGFAHADVDIQFQTQDGALIHVSYTGLSELSPEVQAVIAGGDTPTNYGDTYFFVHVRMETGDERYSWVNQTAFVGQGRAVPGPAVEYRIFRLVS
jgi:hypothetical protein